MNDSPLHVVLGAGQIGTLLASRLVAQGKRVRQVRRNGKKGDGPIEWLFGDLSNAAFAKEAMTGASVVYHCVNAPYDQWSALLEPLARGIVHGAAHSKAKLVVLDNIYMYGRPSGPMNEESPIAPCSKKGELRARIAEHYFAAHKAGEVRVVTGRASDFFGPNVTLAAIFGDRYYGRVLHGKAGESLGNPDLPHSYSYGPDVAEGLITLGEREEAVGKVWHLPVNPAESTRALLDRFAVALGKEPRVARLPTLLLQAMGLFSPMMREVAEMAYEWEVPFVLDDTRFRSAFGVRATPWDPAVAETVAWAQKHYAGVTA